jgi:hypothetical protein
LSAFIEMFGGSRNVAIVLMSIKAIRVPHRMRSIRSATRRLFDFNQALQSTFAVHFTGNSTRREAVHGVSRQDEMDLKEAIYTRRSTRDSTAEPVSEKIIREFIDAAIQAPTAVNAQPCTFCVVHDRRDA